MTSKVESIQDSITFDQFCEEWLREFREGDMSSLEKGRGFAFKLVTQWLEVNEDDEDLVLCDGSGDGGIDVAYLLRSDLDAGDYNAQDGDVWYLIQSKYGSAFHGQETILSEGRKVIGTLTGKNNRISENTRQIVERLDNFRQQASERDRIIVVFATERAMSESDRQALDDLRVLGREHIGPLFEVEDISLNTIWEARDVASPTTLSIPIVGNFVDPSSGLRVGTITLIDLFEFLKSYRTKTGNLDQLYEKNVRKFLGGRRKINRGIAETLRNQPELFGLYNNGITIVVSDFSANKASDSCMLFEPYVVNGCQTTRTIWEVMQPKLDAGGTGEGAEFKDWCARAERGVVVTKIVKGDSASITNITRYTNSQNAVREQDFLALRKDFGEWAAGMDADYGIFLEIQRGGWDSQRAYQRSHPSSKQFAKATNAFDLIKVYGAGWLREPGPAFGRSAPFLPGGMAFKRITEVEPIDSDDLYAAYKLQQSAERFNFGRGADVRPSRRLTRFFFYFVVMDLLRDVLIRSGKSVTSKKLTLAFNSLVQEDNEDTLALLMDAAIDIVDEYVSRESEDSVFNEQDFENNFNTWFKLEAIGKGTERTYCLNSLLTTHKAIFGRSSKGRPSPRQLVDQTITSAIG